ncbi:flavin reductase family protein [Streptomyces sp. CB02923]|uniref:flavin reductase family protein n=1 Tax=Streptomyces sp. CB02923 TaxID=1718985 RepID=UPI0009A0BC61|nr:flavin reductase family protein [Streptomyces sp. CB02923]
MASRLSASHAAVPDASRLLPWQHRDTVGTPVPLDGFRALMSAFPAGVAVITTYGSDGDPRGLTCTSLASVTAEPPILSVCLNTRGETLQALCDRGAFAVNLLHDRARHTAEVFAKPVADRFAHTEWQPSPEAGLPWLTDDAFATAECEVAHLAEIGDHTLVLGLVTGVVRAAGTPLLYGAHRFAAWPGGELPEFRRDTALPTVAAGTSR